MSMIFTDRQAVAQYIADNDNGYINPSFANCVFVNCDLHGFNFRGTNFRGAHIVNCNFESTILINSVFDDASITGSDFNHIIAGPYSVSFYAATLTNVSMNECSLQGASFIESKLRNVRCEQSELTKACFKRAYISSSTFKGSNLSQAKFVDAKIYYCNFTNNKVFNMNMTGAQIESPDGLVNCEGFNYECIPFACPAEGSFVAWKVCRGNIICKILIPEDAKRSSAFGKKCRASKFKVLEIYHIDPDTNVVGVTDNESATSMFNSDWVYERGKTYEEPDFVNDRFKECAPGLHFFMCKQDAVDYAR